MLHIPCITLNGSWTILVDTLFGIYHTSKPLLNLEITHHFILILVLHRCQFFSLVGRKDSFSNCFSEVSLNKNFFYCFICNLFRRKTLHSHRMNLDFDTYFFKRKMIFIPLAFWPRIFRDMNFVKWYGLDNCWFSLILKLQKLDEDMIPWWEVL